MVLTDEGWGHIVRKHPEITRLRAVIVGTVAAPDESIAGHLSGEEWFYRQGAGPARWLRVVVHYEADMGVIVTGFSRRSFPSA